MSARADLLLAFAAATAVHAGAVAVGFPSSTGGGGGDRGADRLSIAAASPAIAAMVREWDSAPAVSQPAAVQTPEIQIDSPKELTPDTSPDRMARPAAPLAATALSTSPAPSTDAPPMPEIPTAFAEAPALTDIDPQPTRTAIPDLDLPTNVTAAPRLQTAPPPADFAPRLTERPSPRPAAASSPAVTRRVATGIGETGTRGTARSSPAPETSQAAQQAAAAAWAAEIQRRIARHHAYPRGSREEGRVRVAMVVLPDGKLSRVSVVKSSGSSRLDKAAVEAVQRAAPFPPAPKSLDDEWFNVGQWISFEQR